MKAKKGKVDLTKAKFIQMKYSRNPTLIHGSPGILMYEPLPKYKDTEPYKAGMLVIGLGDVHTDLKRKAFKFISKDKVTELLGV